MSDYFFVEELKQCQKVFERHNALKGDSYKTCSIIFLRNKLIEECLEWLKATNTKDGKDELVDIINVALMLLWRLNRFKDERK